MTTHPRSGWHWTVDEPVGIGYAWAPNDDENYSRNEDDGLLYRDLGLADASSGALGVWRIRTSEDARPVWRSSDADFDFLYILRGSAVVENEDGENHPFWPGSAAIHPRGYWYRLTGLSDDFEAVWIVAPTDAERAWGGTAEAPKSDIGETRERRPTYTHDTDDEYVRGDGPRSYFLYRDLGARSATADRIHLHVVRATEAGPGTGWHYHTMAQWFMVIGGNAVIRVEDRPRQPLGWGDAMCVGRGPQMRHNVTEFSSDYLVLEMCVPAEYETIATEEPEGADVE